MFVKSKAQEIRYAIIRAYLVDVRKGSDYGLPLFKCLKHATLSIKTLGKLVANIHDYKYLLLVTLLISSYFML